MRNLLVLFHVGSKFLPYFCLLDQFVTDPAATVIRANSHHLVSLCRSVCGRVEITTAVSLME